MREPTPAQIALALARHISRDAELESATYELGLARPRVFMFDDTQNRDDGAPHIIVAPVHDSGGRGNDDETEIAVVVTVRDNENPNPAIEIDPESEVALDEGAKVFDDFAALVWDSIQRAEPGSVLQGRSAEWDFAGCYPLRFVGFTLTYRTIHSFDEEE